MTICIYIRIKIKKKVIIKLYEEKQNLANLMGIEFNVHEVKQILDDSIDDSDNSDDNKSKDFCSIF